MAGSGGPMQERISAEVLREATGRSWDSWLPALDAAGARDWSHKEIVAYLGREHGDATSAWWRQSIAVGYEQARGKRVVGETRDAGFQVGVQRRVEADREDVWELLTTQPDLWLGEGADVAIEPGERYETPEASGEIRVVKPPERLRFTWRPEGWTAPASVQLTLEGRAPGRTALHAHLEKLPDAEAREAMRARWRKALERVAVAAG